MAEGDTTLNAVIGAVVTIALSFTGFSPLLGGGVAGYLQGEPPKRGARVGAIAGVIAVIPFVLLLVAGLALFAGIGAGAFGVPGAMEVAVVFLIMVPFAFLWTIGLSAAGGYLGGYVRQDVDPVEPDGTTGAGQ